MDNERLGCSTELSLPDAQFFSYYPELLHLALPIAHTQILRHHLLREMDLLTVNRITSLD